MTVPEWQRARLSWLQQQLQQQHQSFFTATPTPLDLRRRDPNTFSVLPAGTSAFHPCSAFCDEEGSSDVAHDHDLLVNMLPDVIHRAPLFGSSFGSVVDGGGDVDPGMSRFFISCPPVGGVLEAQIRATSSSVAAPPFDVRTGAAVVAAARHHSEVDVRGRESSRKRKAAHEATAEELLFEQPEDDGRVENAEGDGCYTEAMIVPKLETDTPISSFTATADGSDAGKPTGSYNKEATSGASRNKCTKAVSDPAAKTGYIHVRARRGQATDSHSLAERARREKISKRMKLLQELVPGCSGIAGKAGVLDEIINYVQSLQRQIEFLSMKLAAVDPILDSVDVDAFLSKEIIPHHGGVFPSSAGTLPVLEPLDASSLNHVISTMQTPQAPAAAHRSGGLNELAVGSSCPGGEQAPLLLHPTPAPVAVSEGSCLVMDPYAQLVQVLAASTSLWEADLHDNYRVLYE